MFPRIRTLVGVAVVVVGTALLGGCVVYPAGGAYGYPGYAGYPGYSGYPGPAVYAPVPEVVVGGGWWGGGYEGGGGYRRGWR
jgi:hypothetical protein